jgi:hypothetical protein
MRGSWRLGFRRAGCSRTDAGERPTAWMGGAWCWQVSVVLGLSSLGNDFPRREELLGARPPPGTTLSIVPARLTSPRTTATAVYSGTNKGAHTRAACAWTVGQIREERAAGSSTLSPSARWQHALSNRRSRVNNKTIESHNTKAPVLKLSPSHRRPPSTSCPSSTPRQSHAHPPDRVAERLSQDAQPCSFSKSSRRRSSCIPRTLAHSFDPTSIASYCKRRRARVRESTRSSAYWTPLISPTAKCCQDRAMPNMSCTTKPSYGGRTRAKWYVMDGGRRFYIARPLTNRQMDGVVTSVLRTGFFVDCGSLQAFVGRNVRNAVSSCNSVLTPCR